MRRLLSAILAVLLTASTPALADAFEDAMNAFKMRDYARAFNLLQPLADKGNADAQLALGNLYGGLNGWQRDYAEAAKWYRKAAEQGNAEAQRELSLLYHDGNGVPPDWGKAAFWTRKAAEGGDWIAQSNLAYLYQNGFWGMPQDYVLAYMWHSISADKAPFASKYRDEVAAKMTPAQIEEAQRLAREWTARTGP